MSSPQSGRAFSSARSRFRYQAEAEAGQRIVVGVNHYELADEPELPILRIDPALEAKQIGRLQAMRAGRDGAAVEAALGELKRAAVGEVNLMGPILDAAGAYVTLGKMCDALREVWGVWRESPVF